MLFLILTAYFITGSNSGPTLSSDRLAEVPILPEVGTYLIIVSDSVIVKVSISLAYCCRGISMHTIQLCAETNSQRLQSYSHFHCIWLWSHDTYKSFRKKNLLWRRLEKNHGFWWEIIPDGGLQLSWRPGWKDDIGENMEIDFTGRKKRGANECKWAVILDFGSFTIRWLMEDNWEGQCTERSEEATPDRRR